MTEDKKVVYKYVDPPKPSWGYHENGELNENAIRAAADFGTYRYTIKAALNHMNSDRDIKRAQKKSTQKLEKEYETVEIDTEITTLEIIDKDESFTPQYLKSSLGDSPSIEDIRKHVNASDEELAQYQEEKRREKIKKEKKEALEAANEDDSQDTSPCCHTCKKEEVSSCRTIYTHKSIYQLTTSLLSFLV